MFAFSHHARHTRVVYSSRWLIDRRHRDSSPRWVPQRVRISVAVHRQANWRSWCPFFPTPFRFLRHTHDLGPLFFVSSFYWKISKPEIRWLKPEVVEIMTSYVWVISHLVMTSLFIEMSHMKQQNDHWDLTQSQNITILSFVLVTRISRPSFSLLTVSVRRWPNPQW